MRAVTIKEANARLNRLIDAATEGEQVVLMRGSKHVAALVPISEDDLELSARVTDAQLERLRRRLAGEEAAGKSALFDSPEPAIQHLAGLSGDASRDRRLKRARRSG